jgi:hypothetical protein
VYVIGAGVEPDDEGLAGAHWLRQDRVQEDLMKG